MDRHIRSCMTKRLLGTLAAIVLAFGLIFPAGTPAASTTVDRDQITKDFIEALTVVEEHYADDVDYPRLSKAAIFGMLQALDPHSHFYDSDEYEAFRTDQQSEYF